MIGITSYAQPARWGAWELPAALVPYHYVESVERAGGRALGPGGNFWDYVLARVAIDFRRELTQDDEALVVRTRLVRIGTSSLTFREEIVSLAGWVAAEAESVVVARDRDSGRSRPLNDSERAALEAVLVAVGA